MRQHEFIDYSLGKEELIKSFKEIQDICARKTRSNSSYPDGFEDLYEFAGDTLSNLNSMDNVERHHALFYAQAMLFNFLMERRLIKL